MRVYQFRDRDRICCHDISVTQCYALETLVEHGPLRLGGLAERCSSDKSTTSRVVGTLVKKGYAQRGRTPPTPGPWRSAPRREASASVPASTRPGGPAAAVLEDLDRRFGPESSR